MELADEPAEDAASTKMVRRRGLKARLAMPSSQPLGARSVGAVWSRQLRWARLRRVTFPLEFAPEILTGGALPVLAAALAAYSAGISVPLTVLLYVFVWYVPEMALAKLCRWPAHPALMPALVLRDAMIPALWVAAWMGRNFTWRGNGNEDRCGEPAWFPAARRDIDTACLESRPHILGSRLSALKFKFKRVSQAFVRAHHLMPKSRANFSG